MGQINIKRGKQSQKVPSVNFKVAGLCFDMLSATLTSYLSAGFTTSARVKALFSVEDAKAVGINNKHIDETKATGGAITITAAGSVGDTFNVYIKPNGMDKKTLLGSYTVTTSDIHTVADGLGSAINSNKANHTINGTVYPFVATVAESTPWAISLTAPAGLGASINSAGLTVECVSYTGGAGTGTTTITQFSGGVGSRIAVLYYHVKEFFRLCPTGKLYVGLFDNTNGTSGDYGKWEAGALKRMQDFAEGEIKRFGAWTHQALTDNATLTTLASGFHTVYQQLLGEKRYAESILTVDNYTSGTTFSLSSLNDARANDFDSVTIDLGNSGSGEGFRLLGVIGKTIGTTGAWLGVRSEIKCNESVGSRETAVLVGDGEYISCAFSNGKSYKEVYSTSGINLINQLEAYGYLFPKQYQDDSKSVFCTDANCGSNTGDYKESKNLETWHKVGRLVYLNVLPKIETQLFIDAETGEIEQTSKEAIHSTAYEVLKEMGRLGEISTNADGQVPYDSVVVADYIVDGELVVNITIIETKTLKKLTINIGFAAKI